MQRNCNLKRHEEKCLKNKGKLIIPRKDRVGELAPFYGKVPWNKGLTKETDERIAKASEKFQKNLRSGKFKPSGYGKTLSQETKNKIRNAIHLNTLVRHNRCKWGTYKNIHCDSSWELAFLVYNLDHSVDIQRDRDCFEYINSKGETHFYFPDFIIGNIHFEIKGYLSEDAKLKIEAAQKEVELVVLCKKEIKPYIEYVEQKYGRNFCEVLYDADKPNYMNYAKNSTRVS